MSAIRTPYKRHGVVPGLPNAAMSVVVDGWAEHWTTSEATGATVEDDCCHSHLEAPSAGIEARCNECGALWFLIERWREWDDN